MRLSRRRSHSDHRQNQYYDAEVAREAEYYHRKNAERAYIGEAYNGATKDWAIVDVPPGTNRVHMDGVGGAEQDVTWQRYNGVRRSKFIADGHEYDSGYGVGDYGDYGDRRVAPRSKKKEMWTEITKDLVVKDAIEMVGLEYEETEYFYYVMEYLRYVSCAFIPIFSLLFFLCGKEKNILQCCTFVGPCAHCSTLQRKCL